MTDITSLPKPNAVTFKQKATLSVTLQLPTFNHWTRTILFPTLVVAVLVAIWPGLCFQTTHLNWKQETDRC